MVMVWCGVVWLCGQVWHGSVLLPAAAEGPRGDQYSVLAARRPPTHSAGAAWVCSGPLRPGPPRPAPALVSAGWGGVGRGGACV